MAFGPLSDYHVLPPTVLSAVVLVLVAVALYYAWTGRAVRGRTYSAVGVLLVANVAVFVLTWIDSIARGPLDTASVGVQNGLTPALFVAGHQWWALFTSMFVHAGVFHLAMNMIVLWLIGMVVERRLGRRKFMLLYLAAGLFAGIVTLAGAYLVPAAVRAVIPAWPLPGTPNVGASGAIFGLLGYLVVLNPKQEFLLLIPPVKMPAWVLAVVFVVFNLFLAFVPGSRIAWWAHLGGMLVGALWARWDKQHGARVHIDGVTGWGSGGQVRYSYSYRPR